MSRRRKATISREDAAPYSVGTSASERKPKFIDLFCGIGGFRIAFERAGCECAFYF